MYKILHTQNKNNLITNKTFSSYNDTNKKESKNTCNLIAEHEMEVERPIIKLHLRDRKRENIENCFKGYTEEIM